MLTLKGFHQPRRKRLNNVYIFFKWRNISLFFSACDRESRERRTSGSDFNDSGRASSSAESKQTPPCDIETSSSFSFSIPVSYFHLSQID